jgi:hypothetical protein
MTIMPTKTYTDKTWTQLAMASIASITGMAASCSVADVPTMDGGSENLVTQTAASTSMPSVAHGDGSDPAVVRWQNRYSMDAPVRFAPGELEQNGRITLSPGFTPDGKTIFFGQSECAVIGRCPQRLKRSDLTATGWSKPAIVKLPQDARAEAPSVTPDGRTLLFSWSGKSPLHRGRDGSENFDLWALDLTTEDAEPTPVQGPNINTLRAGKVRTLRYVNNETLPVLTNSGNLYFMTERLNGLGERDIYVARKGSDGTFLRAEPLPAPINSNRRDDGVWVNYEENVMLVSYPDRGGSGQADIFISFRDGNEWTQPLNVGSRINSSAQDGSARLSPDLKTILFTSNRAFPNQAEGLLQVWSASFDIEAYRSQKAS